MLADGADLAVEFLGDLIAIIPQRVHLVFQVAGQLLLLELELFFYARDRLAAGVFIHLRHDVLREVEHPVQVAPAHIQQQTQVAGHAPRIPDMSHRRPPIQYGPSARAAPTTA